MEGMTNKIELYTKERIEALCELTKKSLTDHEIMLIVASKKIRFENDLNQELEYMKYMLVYIIIALKMLNKGGSLVLRTYNTNVPYSCSMLFILYKNFDQLTIIKPLSSNLHSSVLIQT